MLLDVPDFAALGALGGGRGAWWCPSPSPSPDVLLLPLVVTSQIPTTTTGALEPKRGVVGAWTFSLLRARLSGRREREGRRGGVDTSSLSRTAPPTLQAASAGEFCGAWGVLMCKMGMAQLATGWRSQSGDC